MINITEIYRQPSQKRNVMIIASLGFVVILTLIIGIKFTSKSSSESEINIEPSPNFPVSEKKPTLKTQIIPTKENQPLTAAIVPPTLEKTTPLSPPEPVTPPKMSTLKPYLVSLSPENKTSSPTETIIVPSSNSTQQPVLTIIPEKEKPVIAKSSPKEKPMVSQSLGSEKKSPTLVLKSPSEVPTFSDNSSLEDASNSYISDNKTAINRDNSEKIEPEEIEPKYQFNDVEKPPINETESLFDYNNQIAEVRKYFQENWQAPQDFKQSLQYRLFINKSGSLQSIIPIGFNAELYLSEMKFPSPSQPFVSPFSQSQVVRLVIQPDGNILTFLDN